MERRWNPADYIGYSEKHGITDNQMSSAMEKAIQDLRSVSLAKEEQRKLLGESTEPTDEERMEIKRKLLERMGG